MRIAKVAGVMEWSGKAESSALPKPDVLLKERERKKEDTIVVLAHPCWKIIRWDGAGRVGWGKETF